MESIMDDEKRQFDTKTALRLLSSKEAGIALVPMAEMEQPQATLFWAAIFFGIFTAIFGSLVSLLTTAYSNTPVIYILGLFLISYFGFFLVFTIRGFAKKKKIRRQSLDTDFTGEDSLARRVGTIERRIFLEKIHQDLGQFVFDKARTISFDEFNKIVDDLMAFEGEDPRRQKFNQRLLGEGLITIDKSDSNHWTVSFDPELILAV
jgi:hypothetical protein